MDVAWVNGKEFGPTQGECGRVDGLSLVCGKAARRCGSKQRNERPVHKRIKALFQGTGQDGEWLGTY